MTDTLNLLAAKALRKRWPLDWCTDEDAMDCVKLVLSIMCPSEIPVVDEKKIRKMVMQAIRSYGYSSQDKASLESRTDGVMIVLGEEVFPHLKREIIEDEETHSENCPCCGNFLRMEAECDRLKALINTPELIEFPKAVHIEAVHQRERWGAEHDKSKGHEDWFWLIGYVAGKALSAGKQGDIAKIRHHIITTAAVCNNWHASLNSIEVQEGK